MADETREISIVIRGKNLSDADFKAAAKGALGLNAEIEKVNKQAQGGSTSFKSYGGAMGLAGKAAGALGLSLTAVGAVQFARSLLADADALTKLSARTGISIQGLQQLQVAGDDAGNSIDEMARAVSQMQIRVAGGDKSALTALDRLGLSVDQFKAMAPEQVFMAVSDAVRDIPNPTDQARFATDAFGKAGLSVLPTLKRGFDDVRDSVVGMSEDAVVALDDIGDAFLRLMRGAKSLTGEFVSAAIKYMTPDEHGLVARLLFGRDPNAFQSELEENLFLIQNVISAARVNAPRAGFGGGLGLPKALQMPSTPSGDALEDLERELAKAGKEHLDTLKKQAEAQEKTTRAAEAYRALWNDIGLKRMEAEGAYLEMLERERDLVGDIVAKMAGMKPELFSREIPQMLMRLPGDTWGGGGTPLGLGGFQSSGPGFFKRGIEDLFGGATSIRGGVSNVLGGIGKGLFEGLGSIMSGGVSSLVNMGLGALTKGLGKLFGRDEESQQVNPMRDQFIAAAGGLEVLNQRAHDAGVTLEAMLRADTVEEYQAAVEDLTGALDFQDQAMQQVQEAMDRYGLSVTDMGQAFAQNTLDDQAAQLVEDFRVLEAAGADVETISNAMSASINAYVQNALAAGATVPSAMHDIIQQMVTMGILTDENGEAFESLEDSGITFTQTMDQQFSSLMDRLDKLIDAITRGLGGAISGLPDIDVEGNVSWRVDPFPEFDEIPGHARGGVFDRPHPAWIAEGGRAEIIGDVDFMTRALVGAFHQVGIVGAGQPAGGTMTVIVLDGQGKTTTLSREQLQAVQKALSGGLLSVPVGALQPRAA